MNLQDFLYNAARRLRRDDNERIGQAYMNELSMCRPDLYALVRNLTEAGALCDPYYDNALLPAFFEVIERNWAITFEQEN